MIITIVRFIIFATMAAIGAAEAYEYIVTLQQRNFTTGVILEHEKCPAAGALFGGSIGYDDFYGCPIFTQPEDGCTKIAPPPIENFSQYYVCYDYVAVIRRGNCSYAQKVLLAQEAKFHAALVYDNVYSNEVEQMGGDGVFDSRVQIPSFFVSKRCALYMQKFPFESGNMLRIHFFEIDFFSYLVPFIVVVSLCFLIAFVALVAKYIKDKRQELRRRLSRRKLKKIPTKKYKKNDIPETCPICLDDFEEGEKLRILPCSHWYHVKCVDPWLTKNRKVCPVCKRKVLPNESDSDESENERAPLITPEAPPSRYGSVMSSYDSEDFRNVSLQNSPTSPASPGSDVNRTVSHDTIWGDADRDLAPAASSASTVGYDNPVFATAAESTPVVSGTSATENEPKRDQIQPAVSINQQSAPSENAISSSASASVAIEDGNLDATSENDDQTKVNKKRDNEENIV